MKNVDDTVLIPIDGEIKDMWRDGEDLHVVDDKDNHWIFKDAYVKTYEANFDSEAIEVEEMDVKFEVGIHPIIDIPIGGKKDD